MKNKSILVVLLLSAMLTVFPVAFAKAQSSPQPSAAPVPYSQYVTIWAAINLGDLATVKDLLKKDPALFDARDDKGCTLLHKACDKNRKDIVEFLISSGADVNAKENDGDTPLIEASEGYLELVKILVAKGADLNSRDDDGNTPLHEAASQGHTDVAEYLISKGAEINARNEKGETPLYKAADNGRLETVKRLVSRGADLNLPDFQGNSPYKEARKEGYLDVADFLMKQGAR